jgi:hypothetical protein
MLAGIYSLSFGLGEESFVVVTELTELAFWRRLTSGNRESASKDFF